MSMLDLPEIFLEIILKENQQPQPQKPPQMQLATAIGGLVAVAVLSGIVLVCKKIKK